MIKNEIDITINEENIHINRWETKEKPKGILMILHGMSEHGGRYGDFAQHFNEKRMMVVAHDHPGHGKSISDDTIGDFGQGGWEGVVEIAHKIYVWLKGQYPGVPVFILGHSMGSLVARYWMWKRAPDIEGLILTGTSNPSNVEVLFAQTLIKMECLAKRGEQYRAIWCNRVHFGLYSVNFPEKSLFSWLSSDEMSVKQYEEDPMCGIVPTIKMYAELFKGISKIKEYEKQEKVISFPILIAGGEKDPVGNRGEHLHQLHAVYGKMTTVGAELEIYPQMRHEILNEKDRLQVYKAIEIWLEKQLKNDIYV